MTRAAGALVDVADFTRTRFVRKLTTDSSAVNSTTLVTDAHIAGITLPAGRTYKVELYAAALGPAAVDIRFAWLLGGGAAVLTFRSCMGPAPSSTDVTQTGAVKLSRHAIASAVQYGTDGTNTSAVYECVLVETTTSNAAGTIGLQWAQGTANATAVQLTSATFVVITEVDPG